MDLINEFAFILSKNKPVEFNQVLPANSKIRKLYDLITLNKVKSDEEASRAIYDTTRADKKYLMLKRNLVRKLSDLVYLQDYERFDKDNYMHIHFQVEKELLIAEKLLLKNVYHNPTKIITKVEQTAENYFFIDIQVSAARKFRSVYALKGFPKETAHYDEKVKKLARYQDYYNSSRGMWEILYSKTKYSISKQQEIIEECKVYEKKIEKWLKIYDSPFIQLFYYKIGILLNHQQNNHPNVLKKLQKTDQLLLKYPFIKTKSLLLDLYYNYARYYRDIRKLDLSVKFIQKALNICDYRAFDKFQIQELNFDIQIKRGNYLEAGEIIKEVNSVPQYQFLDGYDKSAWAIREAYVYIIYYALNLDENIQLLPIFSKPKSLHIFLESTKKSAKDKNGYNLLLLIIRVILYKINDLRDIVNEGNNMLVYYHRHLNQLEQNRTTIFFNQLAKSVSQGLEYDELKLRRQKLEDKLFELKPAVFDVTEIIPFEQFWDFLIRISSQNQK